MKKILLVGLLLTAFTNQVSAKGPIVISCYRGPLKQVIWDTAHDSFVISLYDYGYSLDTANTMATSLCRNPALVGTSDDKIQLRKEFLQDLIAKTRKDR